MRGRCVEQVVRVLDSLTRAIQPRHEAEGSHIVVELNEERKVIDLRKAQ